VIDGWRITSMRLHPEGKTVLALALGLIVLLLDLGVRDRALFR
jgi:hypothetical protein